MSSATSTTTAAAPAAAFAKQNEIKNQSAWDRIEFIPEAIFSKHTENTVESVDEFKKFMKDLHEGFYPKAIDALIRVMENSQDFCRAVLKAVPGILGSCQTARIHFADSNSKDSNKYGLIPYLPTSSTTQEATLTHPQALCVLAHDILMWESSTLEGQYFAAAARDELKRNPAIDRLVAIFSAFHYRPEDGKKTSATGVKFVRTGQAKWDGKSFAMDKKVPLCALVPASDVSKQDLITAARFLKRSKVLTGPLPGSVADAAFSQERRAHLVSLGRLMQGEMGTEQGLSYDTEAVLAAPVEIPDDGKTLNYGPIVWTCTAPFSFDKPSLQFSHTFIDRNLRRFKLATELGLSCGADMVVIGDGCLNQYDDWALGTLLQWVAVSAVSATSQDFDYDIHVAVQVDSEASEEQEFLEFAAAIAKKKWSASQLLNAAKWAANRVRDPKNGGSVFLANVLKFVPRV